MISETKEASTLTSNLTAESGVVTLNLEPDPDPLPERSTQPKEKYLWGKVD